MVSAGPIYSTSTPVPEIIIPHKNHFIKEQDTCKDELVRDKMIESCQVN